MIHYHIFRKAVFFFTLLFCFTTIVSAQNRVEDTIKQLSSENVTGYLQPFLNGYGANLNSGFTGTASIRSGLFFRVDLVGMATIIGDPERVYEAIPPEPFPQEPVQTATIFGGQGAAVQGPQGFTYQMQNGQLDIDYLPFVIPQLTVGNIFNTQFVVRYFTFSEYSEIPDIDLLGLGIRHSFGQYFGVLPIDLAVGVYYQNFTIGEIMETGTLAFDALASKRFGPLTLYGGAQYEYANMNLQYTFSGITSEDDEQTVDLSFRSDNNLRARAGLNLSLGFLHLRGDFSVGNVNVVSAAVGFGI
jgi:hypothetical protein